MRVEIRKQRRKSLALKLTPKGAMVLVPDDMDEDSPEVGQFIENALAGLHPPECRLEPMPLAVVHQMVAQWSERLGVRVGRTQIRPMRNKWGSISTAGTLSLADELLSFPVDLVEYVVVHELLHLKFPNHRRGWRVSMSMYLPDWPEREQRLQAYIVSTVYIPCR